jgi:hypothetical protein
VRVYTYACGMSLDFSLESSSGTGIIVRVAEMEGGKWGRRTL